MGRGLLAAVEAAYDTPGDASTWLEVVVDRVRPSLDAGLGVVALLIDATSTAGSGAAVQAVASRAISDRSMQALGPLVAREAPPEARLRFREAGPVSTVLHTFKGTAYGADLIEAHTMSETADTLYVMAGDPKGVSCVILSPQPRKQRLSPSRQAGLAYLAAHLATANRLRAHAVADTGDPAVEAVLKVDGRMEHGTGAATEASARAALRRGALAVMRARASTQEDALGALRDWEALVRGRWSLVDHFDTDGQRFLIARRNDPKASPLGDLNEHEAQVVRLAALGHSNKLIAYALGVATTTVSSRLGKAMRKLGIASRVELIRVLAEENEGGF